MFFIVGLSSRFLDHDCGTQEIEGTRLDGEVVVKTGDGGMARGDGEENMGRSKAKEKTWDRENCRERMTKGEKRTQEG